MTTHEIVAIRKGNGKDRKMVELNVHRKNGDPSGLEINNTIQLEGSHDDLEKALGTGFDVGQYVVMTDIGFEPGNEKDGEPVQKGIR